MGARGSAEGEVGVPMGAECLSKCTVRGTSMGAGCHDSPKARAMGPIVSLGCWVPAQGQGEGHPWVRGDTLWPLQ